MSEIEKVPDQENLPAETKYSLADMKSLFYLLNAKPDTSIKLLDKKRIVTVASIRDLNERITRKLENHNVIGQMTSVNIIFEKDNIKDYASWGEFTNENWNTINQVTESLTLTWDISIKLPRYANPQRHTLKVKLGQSLTPKDMMELVFVSDNVMEMKEKRAAGVVKIDFIDQVLATELIDNVVSWYDGLKDIQPTEGIQKILEDNQSLVLGIVKNFFPILFLSIYQYYFSTFCEWSTLTTNITIANLQLFLIAFLAVYAIGSMIGQRIAFGLDQKIDSYQHKDQFEITRGDEKSLEDTHKKNKKISTQIINKTLLIIISAIVSFFIKDLLEKWIH